MKSLQHFRTWTSFSISLKGSIICLPKPHSHLWIMSFGGFPFQDQDLHFNEAGTKTPATGWMACKGSQHHQEGTQLSNVQWRPWTLQPQEEGSSIVKVSVGETIFRKYVYLFCFLSRCYFSCWNRDSEISHFLTYSITKIFLNFMVQVCAISQ